MLLCRRFLFAFKNGEKGKLIYLGAGDTGNYQFYVHIRFSG